MSLAGRVPAPLRRPLRRLWRLLLAPLRGHIRAEGGDLSAQVPFGYESDVSTLHHRRVAVVCHLFHEDLADEFYTALSNMPFAADVFLSVDNTSKASVVQNSFSDWGPGSLEVRILPNIGRDIAPKLVGFADVYSKYDLVLFIHSKKSLTSSLGDDWRRMLISTLCGSPAIISNITEIFDRYPYIGIVSAQHFAPIRGLLHWDGNFPAARALARRMGFSIARHRTLDFPSGSMFWARPAALRPLLDLGLTLADFPPENNQVGGTNQHAIERLFYLVAEHAGFRWLKVTTTTPDSCPSARAISNREALDAFISESRFDLLPHSRIA